MRASMKYQNFRVKKFKRLLSSKPLFYTWEKAELGGAKSHLSKATCPVNSRVRTVTQTSWYTALFTMLRCSFTSIL